jgi:hypothetical protein
MQSFRKGLVSERQRRARCGRSGGGFPLRLIAFLLAAAAAAAAAASASARVFAGPAVADGAVTGAATPEAAGVPGTTGVSGDAANPL